MVWTALNGVNAFAALAAFSARTESDVVAVSFAAFAVENCFLRFSTASAGSNFGSSLSSLGSFVSANFFWTSATLFSTSTRLDSTSARRFSNRASILAAGDTRCVFSTLAVRVG